MTDFLILFLLFNKESSEEKSMLVENDSVQYGSGMYVALGSYCFQVCYLLISLVAHCGCRGKVVDDPI